MLKPKPLCTGCNRHPADIPGYADAANEYFGDFDPHESLANAYAREDGTYNAGNGHFLCDECYIEAGMPTSPNGWVAP